MEMTSSDVWNGTRDWPDSVYDDEMSILHSHTLIQMKKKWYPVPADNVAVSHKIRDNQQHQVRDQTC